MSRVWNPGDVLLCNDEIVLVTAAGDQPTLYFETQSGRCLVRGEVPDTARPLVVIDPEDREQVERLVRDYFADWHGRPAAEKFAVGGTSPYVPMPGHIESMQAALREFANPTPPKPDEPTGWLARVADDKGDEYVRAYEHGQLPWIAVHRTETNGAYLGFQTLRRWSDFNAVRVLSEGVQP